MTLLYRLLFCYLLLVGSSVQLLATVTVVGGYTAASGETLRKVHGKVNETTDITITVTVSGGDAGLQDEQFIVMAGYSVNSTITDYTHNMWKDLDHKNGTGGRVGSFQCVGGSSGAAGASDLSDLVAIATVTWVQILDDGSCGTGDWFDLKIGWMTDASGNNAMTGGIPNTLHDVDWLDGGVTHEELQRSLGKRHSNLESIEKQLMAISNSKRDLTRDLLKEL